MRYHSTSHSFALRRWLGATAVTLAAVASGVSVAHAAPLGSGNNPNGTGQNGTNQNSVGVATPELGSLELISLGLVAGGGTLLYRKRRTTARTDDRTT